jgi:hypothetical protein
MDGGLESERKGFSEPDRKGGKRVGMKKGVRQESKNE